jgi:uncharacterized protein YfaP (DUF2135 family)
MKTSKLSTSILLLIVAFTFSCKSDEPKPDANKGLVGEKGNPRFNLVFNNETNVDLDLYVQDPLGNIIYWSVPSSPSGGELDVDCFCGSCPQGPTENIFWPVGDNTAPKGTYSYQVSYFEGCSGAGASSNFTLKVLSGNTLIETQTGTLSSGSSPVYTYTHE